MSVHRPASVRELAVITIVSVLVFLAITLGYMLGRVDGRALDCPIVAGDPANPSGIIVHPVARPSGPVRAIRGAP